MPGTTRLLARYYEKGDDSALEELLKNHYDWILAEVRRRLTPHRRRYAESIDFVQETVFDFLRQAPRFHIPNGRAFRSLVIAILENRLKQDDRYWTAQRRNLDRLQEMPSEALLKMTGEHRTPSEAAALNEKVRWLHFGFTLLDPEKQKVILMRVVEGKPFAEIGAALGGRTPGAAREFFTRTVTLLGRKVKLLMEGRIEEALACGRPARDAGGEIG